MTEEFIYFILYTPHLNLSYYIEECEYYVVVRDRTTGVVVWRGIIPRIQYQRAYETFLRQKGGN